MATTKTSIGNFEFENCFMNAAGVYCYDRNELEQVINSEACYQNCDITVTSWKS